MHNCFKVVGLCLPLIGCFDPNAPILLNAINYDFGPVSSASKLKLAGTSLTSESGLGLSREQGEAFFRVHQHKPVHHVGTIDAIRVKGNTAEIELLPAKTAGSKQNCWVADLRRRRGCHPERTRSHTTVTCIVRDWAALNQKTQGTLQANLRNRRQHHRNWDWLHIEGKLVNYKPVRRPVITGYTNLGVLSRPDNAIWAYDSFIVQGCTVRAVDGNVI